MRTYSFFSIGLLCLAILIVDIFAFYWLRSVTQFYTSHLLNIVITTAFWTFSFALIISILILKIRLNSISQTRKHLLISSLYGLTVSSFIPKILFVIIVSILYFGNYIFAEQESRILVPVLGLLSGFIPFFAIVYAISRSLYRFKVYRHTIKFESLPESFDDWSIVQISDLHLGSFNKRYHILDRVVKIINDLDPDLIVFTGDLVNNFAWELTGWEDVLIQLKAKRGKFAVLGNHDYGDYSEWKSAAEKEANFNEIQDFYKAIDFRLLMNESEIFTLHNELIAIIGVENWGKPPFKQYGNLKKAMANIGDGVFKILLSHDPTHWSEEVLKEPTIALTLSGHTHGMQIGIENRAMQWSPIKYKYEHWAGLYKHGKQFLHVNRGLGWLGFPGRLGMRPEITHITLKRS